MPVSRKRKASSKAASSSSSSRPTRRTRSNQTSSRTSKSALPSIHEPESDVVVLSSDSDSDQPNQSSTTTIGRVRAKGNAIDPTRQQAEEKWRVLELQQQNQMALELALVQEDVEEMRQKRREQMMLLPEAIRRMKFRDFLQQFGVQMEQLVLQLDQQLVADGTTAQEASPVRVQAENARRMATTPYLKTPISGSGLSAGAGFGAFTPAPFSTSSRPMPNTVRTVRKGKAVFSHTGSPLTSVQPTLPAIGSIAPIANDTSVGLAFRVTEDFALDLLNPKHRAQLTREGLLSAKEQIQKWQKQMDLALQAVQSAEENLNASS